MEDTLGSTPALTQTGPASAPVATGTIVREPSATDRHVRAAHVRPTAWSAPRFAHDFAMTRGEVPSATHKVQLSDLQLNLERLRQARRGDSPMSRYLLSNSAVLSQPLEMDQREELGRAMNLPPVNRKPRRVYRRKIVLLGHQEVGKTSLRRCFEWEPFLFKRLPDVKTTTGVELHTKKVWVDEAPVEVTLSDFAGQESYHSHTHFLTSRSIFCLVWKISAIEQDFQSSGINAREEERLYKWISEVYAKFPRVRIVLIATHLDELRVQNQRSVEMVLSKVERKMRSFLDRISAGRQAGQAHDTIVGNFAVSCKTRLIMAAGDQLRSMSGQKISSLFRYLSEVAKSDCLTDHEFPGGAIPSNYMQLIKAVENLKSEQPQKLLMSVSELVRLAIQFHVRSDDELLHVVRLMHSWDVVYLLNPNRIEVNYVVVLHPRWLNRMAAALFSYAHILRTPLHLRSLIGGLEYTVSHAEAADVLLMRKGFLRWPLARVLFRKTLTDFLKRLPDDSDISMCLQLLEAMNLLYPVQVPCDGHRILMEECPVEPGAGRLVLREEKVCRYFIPSLSPDSIPSSLRRLAPVFFHCGVRVQLEFNFLPDELWWRLHCRLHDSIQEVVVHRPSGTAVGDEREDEELLFEGVRLKEVDDEHNRWQDALWLGGEGCRVLACREGLSRVLLYSAETEEHGSEQVLQAFQDAVTELLEEYAGVRQTTYVGCPNPSCGHWINAETVATSMTVTCDGCQKQFESKAVVSAGIGPLGPRVLSDALLHEAGELLSYCLSYCSCRHLCHYLGIPYKGPVPQGRELTGADSDALVEPTDAAEVHVEYLHALDKVVQAALFINWMQRVEEKEKRKRMLEVEPTSVFYLGRDNMQPLPS